MSAMSKRKSIVNILINRELSSIEFVRDYFQLRFDDGPLLNVINDPELFLDGKVITKTSPDFNNLLIGCIDQIVTKTFVEEDNAVEITFGHGLTIHISLKPGTYKYGPEAIYFSESTLGRWEVW